MSELIEVTVKGSKLVCELGLFRRGQTMHVSPELFERIKAQVTRIVPLVYPASLTPKVVPEPVIEQPVAEIPADIPEQVEEPVEEPVEIQPVDEETTPVDEEPVSRSSRKPKSRR